MSVNNLPTTAAESNKTNKFFSNYYNQPPVVSSAQNNALVIFFEKFTGDKSAARVLAGSVILAAQQQNLDIMKVLDDFQKLDRDGINAYLTMLMNLNRVNTSLLGVVNVPPVSSYVTRAIRP